MARQNYVQPELELVTGLLQAGGQAGDAEPTLLGAGVLLVRILSLSPERRLGS